MPPHADRIRLTPALLGMPAPHAVRLVASGLLEGLLAAHERFAEGDDRGLHDLRVAMRRLRSWMRAFRPELSDTVRGRTRRRLRALASATNEARDAEVLLAFLQHQTSLPSRPRATARALADQLEHTRGDHARAIRRTLSRDLTRATHALATELDSWWERHSVAEPRKSPIMSAVFADAVEDHARRAERALARVRPDGKADDVHHARITVKRLRYLLEPLDESLGASEPVRGGVDAHDSDRLEHRGAEELAGEVRADVARSDDGHRDAAAGCRGHAPPRRSGR
jgi:CHAD domain-containing protein